MTKLCHIKCDHPANFYISLELQLLTLFIEQMTSLLTSCYIRHVCWHYKSVCSLLINFYEWIKYPMMTNCAKDQRPPNSPDLTQPNRLPCVVCDASSISQTSVKAKDHHRDKKKCTAADLWWLATDNDQQSYQWLSQTSERVRFGRWWTLSIMGTGWSRLIWHNLVKVADNWITRKPS